jgi:hypothetical protein
MLAYANGQLSESAYVMKHSRFGALAVTLLGTEMLSGDTGSISQPVSSPSHIISNSSKGTTNAPVKESSAPTPPPDDMKTAANTPTSSQASQGARGAISDQQALMVEQMQANFLKDEQLTPSMIACVSYYDRKASEPANAFTRYCQDLFKHHLDFHKTVLELIKEGKIKPQELSSYGLMTPPRRVPDTGARESIDR